MTDPFNAVINYDGDKLGRVASITGSGFGGVSTYASGIKFRAFGAVKEMAYGSSDGSVVSYGYDNRLRPESYQATSGSGFIRKANYEYFADGRVKAVDNILDGRFDQSYKYDHAGRMTASVSGNVTNVYSETVPAYQQTIGFNAFGDMTSRASAAWGEENDFTADYTNGRKTGGNEMYDAAGNLIDNTTSASNPAIFDRWTFDASGAVSEQVSQDRTSSGITFDTAHSTARKRDGDGRIVKSYENRTVVQFYPAGTSTIEETEYYVRSTMLGGQVLTEVNGTGGKIKTNVYAGSGIIAEQIASSSSVVWRHTDVLTGSFDSYGTFPPNDGPARSVNGHDLRWPGAKR